MSTPYTARCACGGFRFSSTRAPFLQLTCHCQQCRSASGTPSTDFAFFKLADATIAGATTVQHFVADSGAQTVRERCTACGELVLDRTAAFPKIVGVVAQRLQPPYSFQPQCHVWLESKLAEVDVPAGVQVFARGMS